MDQLFKIGKSMFGGGHGGSSGSGGHSSSGGGGHSMGGGGMNPFAMYNQIDRNHDGSITEEDFVLLVKSYNIPHGDAFARQAFKYVDKNRNGKLDMSEAVSAFEVIQNLLKSQGGGGGHAY